MKVEDLQGQLEYDLLWRNEEIAFFFSLVENEPDEKRKSCLMRATILILYAHYEGFVKFALQVYLKYVNSRGLVCSDVNAHIVAAVLHDVFKGLRDVNSQAKLFKQHFKDDQDADGKIKRTARDIEFISSLSGYQGRSVKVDEKAIDTESNLWPHVLRKNLFRLGFSLDIVDSHKESIQTLVSRRNSVAHGQNGKISMEDFLKLKSSVSDIVEKVRIEIIRHASEEKFRASDAA